MLNAIYRHHPNSLSKQEVLAEIDYTRPPPINFRQHSKAPFVRDVWTNMKTLINNELVKSVGKPAAYSLTKKGYELSIDLFGEIEHPIAYQNDDELPVELIVNEKELSFRTLIDLPRFLEKFTMKSESKKIPFGTFWFSKNQDIYDCIIQIGTPAHVSDPSLLKRLAGSPFSRKIFIAIEQQRSTQKKSKILRAASDYGVSVTFISASSCPTSLEQFLLETAKILHSRSETIGSFDTVVSICNHTNYSSTVGAVWKDMLTFVPGLGPTLAANMCMAFPTPHCLSSVMESGQDKEAAFTNAYFERTKRNPPKLATATFVRLFSPPLQLQ